MWLQLGLDFECCYAAASIKARCVATGPKTAALPPSSTPWRAHHGQELLSRIKFIIKNFAVHVSTSALEPDEPAHNILPFPRTRTRMHATHEPEEPSAPSALAYSMACSMACSMAQAGDGDSSSSSTAAAAAAAAVAAAATAQQQQRPARRQRRRRRRQQQAAAGAM